MIKLNNEYKCHQKQNVTYIHVSRNLKPTNLNAHENVDFKETTSFMHRKKGFHSMSESVGN